MTKQDFTDAILATYINRDLYGTGNAGSSKQPTRKQKQCPYRLLNILFSNEFAADFGTMLDETPIQAQLDSGDAHSNCGFWIHVETAYKEPHPIYDKMRCSVSRCQKL